MGEGTILSQKGTYKYHNDYAVCTKRVSQMKKARKQLLQDAERRIGEVRRAETRRLQKVKAKREKLAAKEAMEPVSLPTNTKVEETHEEFEHPDDLLKTLKRELHFEQTHHIGPMYPGVFKKLEFRRPKANVKKKKEKAHNHDPVSLFQAAAANYDAVNSLQSTVTNHDPANVFKAAAAFQELGSVFQVAADDTVQLEAEEGQTSKEQIDEWI